MKVFDKNGTELKIGDTVHYKTLGRTFELNGKTFTRPAKDIKFTIDGFVDSPFVKHGGYDPRMGENLLWITGEEFLTPRGSKNSVSPLAVVKVDTLVKKKVTSLSFIDIKPPTKDFSVTDAVSSDVVTKYKSFLSLFKF